MRFIAALREDVEEMERKVDAALESIPLPSIHLNTSQYHIVTASEDRLRIALLSAIEQGGAAIPAALGMLDNEKYALKQALSIVRKRQSSTESGALNFALESTVKALSLLDMADEYENAIIVFSTYYAGLAKCNISKEPPVLQFLPKKDSDRFNVLDALEGESFQGEVPFTPMLRWFAGPEKWSDLIFAIVDRVKKASEVSVAYAYEEELGKRLFKELPLRLIILPDSWSSSLGTANEIAHILHALQTLCAYHIISITLGARVHNVSSLSEENVALLLARDELYKRCASLSNCPSEQIARLFETMTYGVGVMTPDPALQPLIDVGANQLLLPPITILSSHVQRNFLVLLARADKRSFDRVSHHFEKSMIEGISTCLIKTGWVFRTQFYIPGAREAGEVDLVVVDPQSRMALICELKWTIPVADTREVINREAMVAEKVPQLKRKMIAAKANLHLLLQELGIPISIENANTWKLEGAVVVEGFAAQVDVDVPVVTRSTFEWGIRIKKNLKSVFYWLRSEKWLPQRDVHFHRVTRELTINGVQIRWPGLMPTPEGFRFVRDRG